MDWPQTILVRLRAPSGGVVADTMIIDAAREAATEIERLGAALRVNALRAGFNHRDVDEIIQRRER